MSATDLERRLAKLFDENDYTWTLNGKPIQPDEDDFEKFLDEAVRHLYNEQIGARLTVGRLIIEKVTQSDYHVYAYMGTFN